MNIGIYFVNLTSDPEELKLGERDCVKLRVADNTPGKNSEPRFFDAILGQQRDTDKARRLAKGDRIALQGTLELGSYKAKKDGRGIKKGQTIRTDSMPFATIIEVVKSPTFFAKDTDPEAFPPKDDGDDEGEPDLETGDKPDPLEI